MKLKTKSKVLGSDGGSKKKLKYIPDEAINLLKKDLLSTLPYVHTLSKIVKNCSKEKPFTIGLFGTWGSGKSSIVKTLQNEFNNNSNSRIKVFIYDAWKYSKDSFRRTFILELEKFFNLKSTDELKSFYQDRHEEIDVKVKLIKNWWFFVLMAITIIFILILIFVVPSHPYVRDLISNFVPILTFFCGVAIVQHKISMTKPKVFAPEQFENIYKDAVDKIIPAKNNPFKRIKKIARRSNSIDKIVIVIDNIDRCEKELSVELLGIIKNFLENKNVVFIIPIDDEAIRNSLKLSNQDSVEFSNEFLRKLFSTTVRMKKFSDNELFDFCSKLNKEYELDLPDTVLSIVAQEFSKNPRRIIQFLNTFQTEFLLAKEQEKLNSSQKDIVAGNLPMLAKLIIIREEWPELYKLLADRPTQLEKINKAFREKQFEKIKDDQWKLTTDNTSIKFSEEKYRFLMRTHNITATNLEPFFINRDVFSDIPDEINDFVRSQDWDALKKHIEEGNILFDKLIAFIANKADRDVIKKQQFVTSGFNLLSLIFKIGNDPNSIYTAKLKKILLNRSFNKIRLLFDMGKVKDLIFTFNPEDLVNFSKWLYNEGSSGLLDNIVKAINEKVNISEAETPLIRVFIQEFADTPEFLKKIKNKFSEIIASSPQLYEDFKNIFENSPALQYLIVPGSIATLIDSLEQIPDQINNESKVNILNSLRKNNIIPKDLLNSYVKKILSFIDGNDWSIMQFWLKALAESVKKVEDISLQNEVYQLLVKKYQFLFSKYTSKMLSEVNLRCYKAFLDISKELYKKPEGPGPRAQTVQWINEFFNRNESPKIYLHVNNIYYELVDQLEASSWPFSQYVIDKFRGDNNSENRKEYAKTLNLMLIKTTEKKELTTEQIDSILDFYINIATSQSDEQSQMTTKWLKEVIKNKLVKEQLAGRIKLVSEPSKQIKLLGIIKKLENYALLKETLISIFTKITCENFSATLDKILKQKINEKALNEALKTFIDNLKTDKMEQYKCSLKSIIEKKSIKGNAKIYALLIDKIRPLLASDKTTEQEFALELINEIKTIPGSKIELLKTLLNEIDKGKLTDDGKNLLNKVENKIERG